ncbi:MAG TPA: efflux RND transporter permease subunit, partial [Solirubrobacterales bacterium]
MTRIADLTWRHPKLVLAAVAAFTLLAAVVGRDVEQHLKAAGFTDSASESERAGALLRDGLGYDPNPGLVVVVREPDGGRLETSAPAVRREVAQLSREIAGVENVGRVVDPLRGAPGSARLVAQDGESLTIPVYLSTDDIQDAGGIAAEDVREILASSRLDVALAGYAAGFDETNDQTREDLTKAELIAFPILALLLLFVFRGVIAAAIPLLLGVISIIGTLLVLRVMSSFADTSLFALNIATGLSLGLAVDYALLLVSRYREEIGRGGASREAHRRTVQTAGKTAVFSGLTVAAAMAALIVMPQRFLYSMAVAGASAAVLSAVMAILVVPSLLRLLGTRIDALSVRRGAAVSDASDGWYRLARGVMRRPVAVALGSSALLLAAAAPLLWTTLTGPSAEAVPPGKPSYDAYRYLEAHYPRDVTEAVTVTVNGEADPAQL